MTNRKCSLIGGALFIVFFLICAITPASAQRIHIKIDSPFLRKIPLAAPAFTPVSEGEAAEAAALQGGDWLVSGLEFTRFFKILPRDCYLIGKNEGLTARTINFSNWNTVGAELLITGGIIVKQDVLEMELRLFDVTHSNLIVGKRYKGKTADLRKIIRRFCAEVVYALSGTRGIFGTKIAFVSTTTGNKEIYTCEFDGFDPQQITSSSNIALSPAWSGDGRYLAYCSYADKAPHIFIKNLKQKQGTKIAFNGINITPAWMSDRFALGATLSLNGDQDIYSLTGKGKIIKNLTQSWGIDVSPNFSPDGKKMTFVSNRGGSPQIYVKDLRSGDVNRVTFSGRYNSSPCFSPDGRRIAFAGMKNGLFDIYTIRPDGSDLERLTKDSGDNESPTYSPDGTLIAFSSTRQGVQRIYVMTANGTDEKRLLSLDGAQSEPAWSPRLAGF